MCRKRSQILTGKNGNRRNKRKRICFGVTILTGSNLRWTDWQIRQLQSISLDHYDGNLLHFAPSLVVAQVDTSNFLTYTKLIMDLQWNIHLIWLCMIYNLTEVQCYGQEIHSMDDLFNTTKNTSDGVLW